MQDEQVEQTDEAVEPTAEDTAGDPEAAADDSAAEGPSSEDADTASAVDTQAAPGGGAGETVLKQPEVPDDANDTIAAAQQHINNLDMDAERKAAERAQKNT